MGYKCEYDGKSSCWNCKFFCNGAVCTECGKAVAHGACPVMTGRIYPHDEELCKKCLFEPKEREVTTMEKEDYKKIALANERTLAAAIKDSGERREFETGAVRDMSEGKGLMVVMPASALLRLSRHYEHGAGKYGRWNYNRGIPVSSFMDSALRHIMKYLDGWDDEDHLSAAAFNILGAMEMEAHKPEMLDIPAREGTRPFNYRMEPDEEFVFLEGVNNE